MSPEDYQRLIDTYGPGEFDGHIRLRAPYDSACGPGLISMNDGYFEELEDVWEVNGETPPAIEDAEAGTTLVVWARTKDGDTLNWVVPPGTAAEAWTVLVLDADATAWEPYEMSATDLLARLLAAEVDSGILSSELTPTRHLFQPAATS